VKHEGTPRHAATLLLAGALAGGCAFGVEPLEVVATARRDDLLGIAGLVAASDAPLVIEGRATSVIEARAMATGLVSSSAVDAARESVSIALDEVEVDGARMLALDVRSGLLPLAGVEVDLPETMGLDLELGSSAATVRGVRGPLRVRAENGPIEVSGATEAVLVSDSGSVRAALEQGAIDATTGAGRVEVELCGGGGRISTGSGAVELVIACPLTGALTIVTGDGAVTVVVRGEAGAELDLRGPEVEVDAGGVVHRGGSLRGTMGTGGSLLVIQSGAGRIRIREEP
jgi:hypothetical protein